MKQPVSRWKPICRVGIIWPYMLSKVGKSIEQVGTYRYLFIFYSVQIFSPMKIRKMEEVK